MEEDLDYFGFSPADLRPPAYVLEGLKELNSLDSSKISALKEALEICKYPLTTVDLISKLSETSTNIEIHQLTLIIRSLRSIYDQFHYNESWYDTAESYSNILKKFIEADAKREGIDNFSFSVHLPDFISMHNSIGYPMHAEQVKHLNEKNFLSSRIISDVRPLFSRGEIESTPVGTHVLHKLQIKYSSSVGPNNKEVFLH